jgi:hypothetical protein
MKGGLCVSAVSIFCMSHHATKKKGTGPPEPRVGNIHYFGFVLPTMQLLVVSHTLTRASSKDLTTGISHTAQIDLHFGNAAGKLFDLRICVDPANFVCE